MVWLEPCHDALISTGSPVPTTGLQPEPFWATEPVGVVLAPLGRALASPSCKLQLLHLDQADVEPKGLGALVDGLLENKVRRNLRLGDSPCPQP